MTISDPDNSANYNDVILKNGYLAGVTTGWNTSFTKGIMAMELEYNYIFGTDLDKVRAGGSEEVADGTVKIHALLFNLKARYPEGRFHPYAGFGLGWSYFDLGDITAGGYSTIGSTGNAFCWQLLAGLDFDITPNFGVGIGYKYFATKPTIGSRDGEGIYAVADYRASMITAGLTFTF